MQWKRVTELVFWHIFGNFGGSEPGGVAVIPHRPHAAVPAIAEEIFSGSTCNTPSNRQCWTDKFNINTDFEKEVPEGVVRNYFLEVTNEFIAPDGFNVSRMLFNKQYPGPLIEGNWGDTFNITIKNSLKNHNGTSVHWHGIRQWNTNWMDGVSGITECPLSPGETFTYTWRATQYGVSWYHSHFSLQYPDGLVGPIKINGPSSMNYDVDLGPVLITDHFHKDAFSQVQLEYLGRPPSPDSMLLNGNGTYYCCSTCPNKQPGCVGGNKLTEFKFEKGKTYRMTLVNTATSTHMTFWIDNHEFDVISTDFVPIKPYPSKILNIAIGQRYDIIIKANASVDDYWIHARDCSVGGARSNLGIIRYDTSSEIIPYTPPIDQEHLCYGCLDELHSKLKPIVKRDVLPPANVGYDEPSQSFKVHLIGYPDDTDPKSLMHKWVLKDSSFYLDWTQPSLSLLNVAADQRWKKTPFPSGYEPVYLSDYKDDDWVYFLIEGKFKDSLPGHNTKKIYKTQAPVAHPMHIHGHDFVVLATGTEEYDPKTVNLTLKNPPRRDVALLPVDGYLIIAFQINNPGAWLMHCHIAWHASGGLALQFIEKPEDLTKQFKKSGIANDYAEQCTNWGAYYTVFNKNDNATQEDSGI